MEQKEHTRRQFVNFSFYRVLPEWRRLPLGEREEHRREFAETIHKWNVPETMKVLTYSLAGLRAEADFMLWRICYSLSCVQEMTSDIQRTHLGGYLERTHSFLGMTRRASYLIDEHHRHPELRGVLMAGGAQYLFVYPLVRTRSWYQLAFEDRQRMIQEVVNFNREFPRMRLHIIYSFGLDDQDFVVAVESDEPDQYLERVMRLRELEASRHIERDTPMFTCVLTPMEEMLERIG